MLQYEGLVRTGLCILALVYQINQHGLSEDIILAHIEDYLEVLGRISALQNIDIDREVLNSLRLIEHRVRVQDGKFRKSPWAN